MGELLVMEWGRRKLETANTGKAITPAEDKAPEETDTPKKANTPA